MTMLPPLPAPRTALDELAASMERKWGIGRLPLLVSPELRARWDATLAACEDEFKPQADKDAMMMRAWRALDAAATAAGAAPLPPAIVECRTDAGDIVAIAHDDAHGQALALRAKAEGRAVAVWTLPEVLRIVCAAQDSVVGAIKNAFPGAEVRGRVAKFTGPDAVPDLTAGVEG